MSEQGRKYDGGKLRYDLIPALALEDMVKGLTFGTIKYDDNNWVKVPNGRKRYLAAALRHIQEYRKGNLWDEEQNIHHLSAAMNNLSFIVEKDLRGWEDTEEQDISQEELDNYVKKVEELDLNNYLSTLNVKVVDGKFEVSPKLWYPPVEEGGNPWIEHVSSVRPVQEDTRVEVLFRHHRQNEIFSSEVFPAWKLDWEKYDGDYCIIAYRIV